MSSVWSAGIVGVMLIVHIALRILEYNTQRDQANGLDDYFGTKWR